MKTTLPKKSASKIAAVKVEQKLNVTTVDISKCKEFGMDSYISKPIEEKLLFSKIVELVKKEQ